MNAINKPYLPVELLNKIFRYTDRYDLIIPFQKYMYLNTIKYLLMSCNNDLIYSKKKIKKDRRLKIYKPLLKKYIFNIQDIIYHIKSNKKKLHDFVKYDDIIVINYSNCENLEIYDVEKYYHDDVDYQHKKCIIMCSNKEFFTPFIKMASKEYKNIHLCLNKENLESFIRYFRNILNLNFIFGYLLYYDLSEKLIEEFKDDAKWVEIHDPDDDIDESDDESDNIIINWQDKDVSEGFLRVFKDKFDWYTISNRNDYSDEFIREFHNKLDWDLIKFQNLSEDIIREFHYKVDLNDICWRDRHNEMFSNKFIIDFYPQLWLNSIEWFYFTNSIKYYREIYNKHQNPNNREYCNCEENCECGPNIRCVCYERCVCYDSSEINSDNFSYEEYDSRINIRKSFNNINIESDETDDTSSSSEDTNSSSDE